MIILGISAFYHDAAAALVVDGEIIAAAQEENFTRIKHDSSYPKHSVSYCLTYAGLSPCDVDFIVFYEKPLSKFWRLIRTYFAYAPLGFNSFIKSMPLWVYGKLYQKASLLKELECLDDTIDWSKKLLFSEHHLSHAASAFFPSPFDRAAVLTMDGVGELSTTSVHIGNANKLDLIWEISFPHSLGLLYSAFTSYIGFKVNSGEYKVMGLAPYGKPVYVELIKDNLINIRDDGSFQLNMKYFDYCTGLQMTNQHFHDLFGAKPRLPESPLTQRDMDIAASLQKITEEIVLKIGINIAKETGEKNLCLAGGVALNCVANGKLLQANIFENIWIQPASGDAGSALGAALAGYYLFKKQSRKIVYREDGMKGGYLGPKYSQTTIESELFSLGAKFEILDDDALIKFSAFQLSKGKILGWHQGRGEFGPRALGARSIIADPRSVTMQKSLNLKIKYRESFRPFAPSTLKDYLNDWFDIRADSPYMLLVGELKKDRRFKMTSDESGVAGLDMLNIPRSEIPAVTHVDYTSRIQTVTDQFNKRFYNLILEFREQTGCPMVINTSLNVRGEPICNTPKDAFRCFMGTEMDILVIGNCILKKEDQDKMLLLNYETEFDLD